MRKIFSLLILIPLIINVKSPLFDWNYNWNWNWSWDWDFSWKDFIDKFKSKVPDFIKNLENKVKDFMKQNETQRNTFITELNTKVKELYEKIKQDIKDKKDNIESELKTLIEKTTEASKFLSYKICDIAKMDYEECRNDKKKLFTNLLDVVEENFGECSVIIGELSKLSDDYEQNLKYFLFMIIALSENPDAIEEGKSQIIYDILNCLKDKLEDYWPSINSTIFDNDLKINTKIDIIKLLLNTLSNLIKAIHFEFMDGYINSNETSGLITDSKAKQIYQGIFNLSKKLNEFGSKFYNISSDLALDVIINPKNLSSEKDIEFKWINDENKGIRINLHANYLLRDKGADSVQAVIFESPLVSIKGEIGNGDNISNIFVGITLYDKDGNEIYVKDIDLEKYRPIIYFKQNLYKAMTTCLFYNEDEDIVEDEGISTSFELLDGEKYIKCIPKHLTSFTIGSRANDIATSESEKIVNNNNDNNDDETLINPDTITITESNAKNNDNNNNNNNVANTNTNNNENNNNDNNNNNDVASTNTNNNENNNNDDPNKFSIDEAKPKSNSGRNNNAYIIIMTNLILTLLFWS